MIGMMTRFLIFFAIGLSSILVLPSAKADLPNFAKVSDGVYRGGRPTTNDDIVELKKNGIRTIINLQGGDLRNPLFRKIVERTEPGELQENIDLERTRATEAGIQFLNFPLDSLGKVNKHDDASINKILSILNDPNFMPVFVHCEHGRDRTGLIVSLYRVKTMGVGIHQAHEEWETYGHEEVDSIFTGHLDVYFYKKALSFRNSRNRLN
jgi:protein tyrosine/serine phosphatase